MSRLSGKVLYDFKMSILRRVQWFILKLSYCEFGKKSVIESPFVIRNKDKICIGKNVTIRKNARIEVVTQYNNKIYRPSLRIGDNTTIEFNLHITCASEIIIGNNVLIAGYVTIVDANHGYEDITIPIQSNDLTEPKKIFIGEGSFIGMGARIMPGVSIGKHCSIGANSVVNKDIPDYSVAVGIPTRVVKRYNFNTKTWEKTNSKGEFLNE